MAKALNQRVKGLATVAMLKTQFDAGGDHLEMFMPFVVDTIASMPRDDMTVGEVREQLSLRHSLAIPDHILGSLLKRATKKGYTTRDAGRYRRNQSALPAIGIQDSRAAIERQQTAVAQKLREFSAATSQPVDSDEQALDLLLRFIEHHHIAVIVSNDQSGQESASLTRKETSLVARYLKDVVANDALLSDYVQRMLEGFVLQSVLLLNDVGDAERKFDDLAVYVDTRSILRAIGLCGEAARITAQDTFSTLKASNAKLVVFESTVEEVERVLGAYEHRLATPSGMRSLYPTEVTRHVLAHRLKPSDIRLAIGTLKTDLAKLGISIRPIPKHVAKHTLDESDLSRRLMRDDDVDPFAPRIVHDVTVAAAIITLRAGQSANTIDRIRAVFATNSGLVVRKIREWFRDGGESGIPPAVSEVALANAAWLRKPTSAATNMKLHQLIALCSAALQPSRKTWLSFTEQLRKIEESGRITSEEALLASVVALTEDRLAESEEESEVDAETLDDVIARVRESYGSEAEQLRRRHEAELAAAQSQSALLEHKLDRVALNAKEKDEVDRARSLAMEERVRRQLAIVASGIAWLLFVSLVGAVVLGAVFALPDAFPTVGRWRIVGWVMLVASAALGLLHLIWGKHLNHLRASLKQRVYKRLCVRFLGRE